MSTGGKVLFLLAFVGCNQNPVEPTGPQTGSETHWLESCDVDADCGEENACVCGVCTVPCGTAEACAVAGEASICALAGAPEAVALCGALPAGAAGICARSCDGGCPEGQACEADVCVPVEAQAATRRRITQAIAPGRHAVDFLFVVDNSGSMCQEQAALTRTLEAVVPTLSRLDYRIAVISTDMRTEGQQGRFLASPAPPEASLNCRDAQGEPFVPDTADCGTFLDGRALPEIINARETPDLVGLKGWFRCLATLGTSGDGFEKGLSASRLALGCDGPNAAHFGSCCTESGYDRQACSATPPDFLRPEADLVVVYVTDEDDCSDPASDTASSDVVICREGPADADGDLTPDAYAAACPANPRACFQADCGVLEAEACHAEICAVSRAANSNCEWHRDRLLPVQGLREQLLDLKGDPGALAIWSFVGEEVVDAQGRVLRFAEGAPAPICDPIMPEYDPEAFPEQCCTEGVCVGEVQTTCGSDLGQAFAGHRYLELARSVPFGCAPGDARADCGLCGGFDLAPPMATLPALAYATCLDTRPGCRVVEGLGFRDCNAQELENTANYLLRAEVACPDCAEPEGPRVLAPQEYSLVASERCERGLMFVPRPEAVGEGRVVTLLMAP
jgi:hypothetical protein